MTKKEETKKEETHRIKYKGVRLRQSGKWGARIYVPSKRREIWLGTFNTPEKAARVYDQAALRIRGQNAILNFPPPPPLPSPSSKPRDQETPATTLSPTSQILFRESSAYLAAVRSNYTEINQFVADFRLRNQQQEEYILRVNSQLLELQLPSLSSLLERSTMPFSPSSIPVGNIVKSE